MSTFARLCWAMSSSAARFQHVWLSMAIAGVTMAGTLLVLVVSNGAAAAPLIPVMLVVTATMLSLPALFAVIQLFRALSGCRAVLLAPYARLKMLTSVLVLLLLMALAAAAAFRLPLPGPVPAALGSIFALLMVLMLSGLTWLMFLSPAAVLVLMPVALFPVLLLSRWVLEALPGVGLGETLAAGWLLALLSWSAFAAWYLRSRRVGRMSWSADPLHLFNALCDWKGRWKRSALGASPVRARRAFWHARPGGRLRAALLGLILGFVCIGLPMFFATWLAGPAGASASPVLAGLLLALPLLALVPIIALAANQFARRSRLLWLRGRSRAALFREAEGQVWCSEALWLALGALAAVLVLIRFVLDVPMAVLVAVPLAWAGGVAFAVYLGLMCVRGRLWSDLLVIVLFGGCCAAAAWVLAAEAGRQELLLPLVAVQLAAAAMCREIGRRRWPTIDWSAFKPARAELQGSRP